MMQQREGIGDCETLSIVSDGLLMTNSRGFLTAKACFGVREESSGCCRLERKVLNKSKEYEYRSGCLIYCR